jgi:hypothetical protein
MESPLLRLLIQVVSEENILKISQSETRASYQISVHLAKRFQRRFLKICIEITAF